MRKLLQIRADSVDPDLILEAISDTQALLEALPYVTALRGSRVQLSFRRLLFRFQDEYEISASRAESDVSLELKGKRSTVQLLYRAYRDSLLAFGEYKGPRSWLVRGKLRDIAASIAQHALERARSSASKRLREEEVASADFSEKLTDLAWVSRLLMKSLLVKSEERLIRYGEFARFLEDLHHEGVLSKYRVVYVSGSGNGSFRLLFIDGRLAGVYGVLGGERFTGDTKPLNEVEGIFTIKVYGSLAPLEEVVR